MAMKQSDIGRPFVVPVKPPSHPTQERSDVADAFHARSRFLASLGDGERELIIASATRRWINAPKVLYHAGDPADRLFLLLSGQVRHFVINEGGQEVSLQWHSAGDIVGGAALFRESSIYLASAEVVSSGHLLVWDRQTIRQLAASYPQLLENGLSIASDYFAWFIASHLALVCDTARQRLARVLTTLSPAIGEKMPSGARVLKLTNEELANASNLTKFTVCRILREWQLSGALAKERGKVIVVHADLLR